MMQVLRCCLIVIISTGAALLAAPAQAVDVEVKVFEEAANAVEARAKALAHAEKQGFEALVKERAPDRLNQILSDYKGVDISTYIMGYHAKNEVVTDGSYRAIIVLDFDDKFVENLLHQVGAAPQDAAKSTPESLQQNTATLIIPVLRGMHGILLWEKENIWREAINSAVLQHGKGRFVVAYGDPNDKLSLNASTAPAISFARLLPLLERYGASKALIAVAQERGGNGYALSLRMVTPQSDSQEVIHLEPEADVPAEALLEKAALDLIQNYHKRQQEAENPKAAEDAIHSIKAFMLLNAARDWSELRQRLHDIPAVLEIHVTAADSAGVSMSLKFQGDAKKFGAALAEQGITASQQGDALQLSLR